MLSRSAVWLLFRRAPPCHFLMPIISARWGSGRSPHDHGSHSAASVAVGTDPAFSKGNADVLRHASGSSQETIPHTPSTAREPPTVQDKPSSGGNGAACAKARPARAKRCPVDIVAPHEVLNMVNNEVDVPLALVDASVDLIGGYDPGAYGVEMGTFHLLTEAAVLRCLPGGDDPLLNVAALKEHIRRALVDTDRFPEVPCTIRAIVAVIAVSSELRARQLREVLVSDEPQAALRNTAVEEHPFIIVRVVIAVHLELWRRYRNYLRMFERFLKFSEQKDFSDLPVCTTEKNHRYSFFRNHVRSSFLNYVLPTEIVPDCLFVGDVSDSSQLRTLCITHLVDVSGCSWSLKPIAEAARAEQIAVENPTADISAHFDRVYDVVFGPAHTAATSPRRVLICSEYLSDRISRSATLVVACLMKAYFDGRSEVTRLLGASPPVVCVLKECLGLVVSQRAEVKPDEEFLLQLMALEAQLISTRAAGPTAYRPSFASVDEIKRFIAQVDTIRRRGLDWKQRHYAPETRSLQRRQGRKKTRHRNVSSSTKRRDQRGHT